MNLSQIKISDEVLAIKNEVINNRRYLHQNPEPGFCEINTAEFIEGKLKEYGLTSLRRAARTGIICNFNTGSAKTILLRADMDGLPIEEKNDIPYRSQNKGVMHACGHDGHIAMLLGIARLLPSLKEEVKVNVKLMFQPAEESPGGALPMIEEGLLENPTVDYAFALHLWNELEVGQIGLKEGPVMACGDRFDIEIIGKGGHGAVPHLANDPVVVLAHIIQSFQTVVSRMYSPFEPLALSFGTVQGGYAFNVIPDKIKVSGTFRTFNPTIREEIETKLTQLAVKIADAWNVNIDFKYTKYYAPTINNPEVVRNVRKLIECFMPSLNVKYDVMTMGAEDFSFVLQKVPGAYIFIGSKNEAKNLSSPHHSPYFNFDEDALMVGIELYKNILLHFNT